MLCYWLTRISGPIFIGGGTGMITLIVYTYFIYILPATADFGGDNYLYFSIDFILDFILSLFIVFNIYFNYYKCITVDPGSPVFPSVGKEEDDIDVTTRWAYCKKCQKPKPPRCHHCNFSSEFSEFDRYLVILSSIMALLILIVLGAFTGFHLYLIGTGQTTIENLNGVNKKHKSYSLGSFGKNFDAVFGKTGDFVLAFLLPSINPPPGDGQNFRYSSPLLLDQERRFVAYQQELQELV
eukprot:gene4307-5392_t